MLDIILEKQLPIVKINFEDVKNSLIENATKYKNLVVTEESLKDCKQMQKELSRTKKDLDNYRKTVKGEMLVPVVAFEAQCKELIGLVVEVENPLKDSIAIFDDKVRDKKREVAQEEINKAIKELGLNSKYVARLTLIDEYMGLSISIKKIKEDIERRSLLLQQEQTQEAENLQIIKDTIENCNKNIDAKMDLQDFQSFINTDAPISQVLSAINDRMERIKANELKAVEDRKAAAEKEVLERIAKAEREASEKARIEERNRKIEQDALEAKKFVEEKDSEKIVTIPIAEQLPVIQEVVEPTFDNPSTSKKVLYFIEMRVENMEVEKLQALSKFLRDNNYDYNATNKVVC